MCQYFFLLHFLTRLPSVLGTTVCFSDPATSLSCGGWDPAAHAAKATHHCLKILALDFFQVANILLVILHVPCEKHREPEMCCLSNYCHFSTRLEPTHCPFSRWSEGFELKEQFIPLSGDKWAKAQGFLSAVKMTDKPFLLLWEKNLT